MFLLVAQLYTSCREKAATSNGVWPLVVILSILISHRGVVEMSSQERGHVLDQQLVASLVDDSNCHGRSQTVKNIDIDQKIGHLGANISVFYPPNILYSCFPGYRGPVTMVKVA